MSADETYGKLPLAFVSNAGQDDARVKFLARGAGYSLFLTSNEAVLTLRRPAPERAARARLPEKPAARREQPPSVLRMRLEGSDPAARVEGVGELPGKTNYYHGGDPSRWVTGVPSYSRVLYKSAYPGVDVVFYGRQREVEYDFIVAPGADYRAIGLAFKGARRLRLNGSGDLVLDTAAGALRMERPFAYQEVGGERREVASRYVVRGSRVRFEVADYDRSLPLVIDPALSYSTYLGGSSTDNVYNLATDAAGNAYITGETFSTNFPGTFNPPYVHHEAFVTKINPSGTAFVYSTYLGGSGNEFGAKVAVGAGGTAYVTGFSDSINYPVTTGAFQTARAGLDDAFVTKFTSAGAISYSTFLGGSGTDTGLGIAVDAAGSAYVTGQTFSSNFPKSLSPFQGTYQGSGDAFVTKLNPSGTALVYSTYLGGVNEDQGRAVAADAAGNAYVTGFTQSTNFPKTLGAFQVSLGSSSSDAFVTKLNASGTAPVYSTFFGGSGNDVGYNLALDGAANVFLTGDTSSANFPTTAGAFQTSYGFHEGFVAKLNAAGSALFYSTLIAGNGHEICRAIVVDAAGNAYVAGETSSHTFLAVQALHQPNANAGTFGRDAFVLKLNPGGSSVFYSTLLGGGDNDEAYGVGLDAAGNVYVAGSTESTNFPTVNALQTVMGGGVRDGFVSKLVPAVRGSYVSQSADFDGDGRTDVAVWRNSTGAWFIIDSSTGAQRVQGWGGPGDIPVAADYDGDGRADLAVWRPSTGAWFIVNSSNGAQSAAGWGAPGDVPVPADYDGDFRADIAVWRPATGAWFIVNSSNGSTRTVGWGGFSDVPVPRDYDGDGRADIMVWRPSTGAWFIVNSSNGSTGVQGWGGPGDIPVPGDYDGDSRSDIAVWRPSIGAWFIVNSSTGGQRVQGWGAPGDTPVPGDYDGDRRVDITVWRGPVGAWFIVRSSTGGTSGVGWGSAGAGDLPVAATIYKR